MDYAKESLRLHGEWKGKIEVTARVPVETKDDLSLAYTPGVAQPCLEIQKDINKSYELTRRWNLCAVITDGSAVLGLGDIGPEAGMPVMEGKCVLFKAFGDVDAFPLYRLPGAFGCLIFNAFYPTGEPVSLPSYDQMERILSKIRTAGRNAYRKQDSDHVRICKLVAWYSRAVLLQDRDLAAPAKSEESRVAYQDRYITRVYFSPCEILEYVREDCQGNSPATPNFEFFRGFSPRAGPAEQDDGGIEYGRFEGMPLW